MSMHFCYRMITLMCHRIDYDHDSNRPFAAQGNQFGPGD